MYNDRIARLRQRLEDPLLVTYLPNIRYLTGFTGSSAIVLVTQDRLVFMTDGRYAGLGERLMAGIEGGELVAYRSGLETVLAEQLDGHERVGLEAEDVRWSFVHAMKSRVDAGLTPTKGVVEGLREIKDEAEVESLSAAARAGDEAFARVRTLAKEAVTEQELGWGLIDAMRQAGGTQAGWPPIVAANANAALPHHLSADDAVDDRLLLLDYGCTINGYHSDMSRTIWLEGEPDREIRRMHEAVLQAQEAGIEAIRPGVTGHDVDEECRKVLREYGYEDQFVHSTGHGVGLEIHEAPRLARKSTDVLTAGHVVTVEPGVYVPGFGGVRIEDMVLVTDSGHRVLTQSDKGLDA
ncbi:MAG: Xaa-Pro peptidase family protein [Acidimicrobiia bacterium]|nr:Xaa-Pro peptidase family protein [Acidimicrobiia bacterium]